MAGQSAVRCPIQCIIPPYMADRMVEHDDPEVRRRGLELTKVSEDMRGQRKRSMTTPERATKALPVGRKEIQIYDAQHQKDFDDRILRRSIGQRRSGDLAVDEAFESLDTTYEFFKTVFERASFDGFNKPIDATVHFGQSFANAIWDGQKLAFGDGNGRDFGRFTQSVDIIAHEFSHGLIQHNKTAKLQYKFQSGALNESLADVFGILVKHYLGKLSVSKSDDDEDSNWLIGEGILLPSGPSIRALRSMLKPGNAFQEHPVFRNDPQKAHMKDYVNTDSDNGGVHLNSGIPNRAFALTARAIGGFAWESPGEIWYEAMNRLQPDSQFIDLARETTQYAGKKWGFNSSQHQAVANAWSEVGVTPSAAGTRSIAAALSGASEFETALDLIAERVAAKVLSAIAVKLQSGESPDSPPSANTGKKPITKKRTKKKRKKE